MDSKNPRGPNAMPRYQIVAPDALMKRIDQYRASLPGIPPSRSDIIRKATEAYLDREENKRFVVQQRPRREVPA